MELAVELTSEGLAAAPAFEADWSVVEVLLAFLYFLMEQKGLPAPQTSSPVENFYPPKCAERFWRAVLP